MRISHRSNNRRGKPVLRFAIAMCVLSVALVTGCTQSSERLNVDPPSAPPRTPSSSIGQLAVERGIRLDALLAQYPDAKVPDVQLVRTVTLEEWPTTMAECLTDQGFPSTVVDGGVESRNSQGQEEAKEVARFLCNVMYPLDPKFNQPLNQDQLDRLYAYYAGALTECLESHEFHVEAPPSRQQFIEMFNTVDSWSPYLTIAGTVSGEAWTALNKDCPQLPEGLYN